MAFEIDDSAFKKDLENLIKQQLPDAIKTGMSKAVLFVEGQAKENAPVDMGQLRASIEGTVEEEGNEVNGYVSANTEYALFVHEGTSKMPARPFLKNAVDQNTDKIGKIIENELKGGK